ncbi:serologically defined colon cancer antigen 8 homolog [Diadema setosum]|uniref:serologically defined colon cancer antigen 8 homolog n=1 Tax=Diadema setosum TaxID=31175 RepID=UPI003B3AAB74
MMDADVLGTNHDYTGRRMLGRASDSLSELKATLNSSPRRPSSRGSQQSLLSSPRRSSSHYTKHSRKSRADPEMDSSHLQSSRLHASDHRALENYNNAVDRLRTLLLSHTHKPSRSSMDRSTRGHRSSDTIYSQSSRQEVPLAMEDAYTYRHSPRLPLWSKVHTEPQPQELLQIINSQSSYIQQLEGENKYCKEELHSLKGRTEAIVAENIKLNEEMKDVIIKTALEESPFRQEEQQPAQSTGRPGDEGRPGAKDQQDRNMFVKWSQELERLKKLHDVRVRRLEEQLTSTKSELETYEKQCSELRSKLRVAESVSLLTRQDDVVSGGLCVRCAQEEAVIANHETHPPDTGTLHRITQERDDLVSRLTASQAAKEEANLRETEAYEQVQQSIQLVEQAQLERTEALVQREQAKEDIVRMQGRMAELVAEQQEKLKMEREATRRENEEEITQLNQRLEKLTEELAAVSHQLDKVTREKVDVQSELDKARMEIMQHEVTITKVSEDNRMSTTTAKVQRDEAMRQLERLRANMEMELRDTKQDNSRLKNELLDVKRRLEQAEKDATTSREESIRLVEKLNTVEREASILRISHESVDKGNRDAIRMLRHRAEQKEQELKQTIHNMENKHALTVNELENMLSDQQSLINKLREEVRVLTDQLESGTTRYRSELRQLKQTNAELLARSERLSHQHADMENQCVEHGRLHHRMKARLHQMEEQNNKNAKQIYELLQKQTSLMQERQVLSKEVEFLRGQSGSNSPFDLGHGDKAWMNGDLDGLTARGSLSRGGDLIPNKDLER